MGTALIPTTITGIAGKVVFLECDCVAEIEYRIVDNELSDWHINDFRFDAEANVWDDMASNWTRKVVQSNWCPDSLRPALIEFSDRAWIEEKLVDWLYDNGELKHTPDTLRADYHASVL
jgi:hypothetical protein